MPLIIREDTVWGSGETIKLSDDVQVAEGVTLTIEDGATVVGNGYSIVVWGDTHVGSSDGEAVTMRNVNFDFSESHDDSEVGGYISMANTDFIGGSFLGEGGYGHFDVTGSRFDRTDGFYIWYPTETSSFSGNLFNATDTISAGLHDGDNLIVTDNAFINTSWSALTNWAAYGDEDSMIVSGNSFLSLRRPALELLTGYDSANMTATGNYFGTLDPEEIQRRVLDANDDLYRANVIDVSNPLAEPSAKSPVFYDIRTATAYGNAADNRLIASATHDRMFGFSGGDLLNARAGDDKIYGASGRDTIIAGRGNDLISGGSDADTLLFAGRFGRDVITDFDAVSEAHDVIDLSKVTVVDDFTDLESRMSQHGKSVWIEIGDDRLVLRKTNVGDLDQSDFVF